MSDAKSFSNLRIVCVMVGLPARGKTHIARKLARYLTWLGITTKVFNVGTYRRKLHGANVPHTFFDPQNREGEAQRREAAKMALQDMTNWFERENGVVAIYDATNSTRDRRAWLLKDLSEYDIQVLFIESICEDQNLILANIKDVKLMSPDYAKMDPDAAAEDFQARISHYADAYETIGQDEKLTYIKLINVGSQVVINMIKGYLQSRIVYYLMNLHIAPRKIFLSRHGESQFNLEGKIGGDSYLSHRGEIYARELPELIKNNIAGEQLTVWTSTLKRTIQTSATLPYPKLQWKALDELESGVCDGMTYEEIEEKYPEDFANRDEDKFNYRYRGGESYRDIILRLEPVIMELERQENILIVGHQAILRCIYGYFNNKPHSDLPYINIPLHTLIELSLMGGGRVEERHYKADINAVDTHRPKPTVKRHPSLRQLHGQAGEIDTTPMSPILHPTPFQAPPPLRGTDPGLPPLSPSALDSLEFELYSNQSSTSLTSLGAGSATNIDSTSETSK